MGAAAGSSGVAKGWRLPSMKFADSPTTKKAKCKADCQAAKALKQVIQERVL